MSQDEEIVVPVSVRALSKEARARCAVCGTSWRLARVWGGPWEYGVVLCERDVPAFALSLGYTLVDLALQELEEERASRLS